MLTDNRIRELWENYNPNEGIESFARAIETEVSSKQAAQPVLLEKVFEDTLILARQYVSKYAFDTGLIAVLIQAIEYGKVPDSLLQAAKDRIKEAQQEAQNG